MRLPTRCPPILVPKAITCGRAMRFPVTLAGFGSLVFLKSGLACGITLEHLLSAR